MSRDPFQYAACRMPDVQAHWWDCDAPVADRARAVDICTACPALIECAAAAAALGNQASGVWAGEQRPWLGGHVIPDETLAAFTAVFGATFDSHGSSTGEQMDIFDMEAI